MSARRLGIVGLVIAGLAASVWVYLYAGSAGHTPRFRTAVVERGPLTAAVSATGSLNAVITVQVGSQVSGQIQALFANFNSAVKRGELIARIDPASFEARVNQARAEVESARALVLNQEAAVEKARADVDNAAAAVATARANTAKAQVTVADTRRDLDRKGDLLGRELIAQSEKDAAQTAHDSAVAQREANRAQERAAESGVRAAAAAGRVADAQLDAARANLKQKQAALAQAQFDLDRTYIRAPVDGVVVSRNVDVGQTVAASLQAPVLFTIAQDLSRMQVDTNVDEADVGRIRVGQRATFTVDAFPTQTFPGEVNQIRKAPQILQNVVTYNVVIYVQNSEQKLLPGMTANVRIVVDSKPSVLRVPNAALRFRPPSPEPHAAAEPRRDRPGAPAAPGQRPRAPEPGGPPAGDGSAGRVWVLGADGQPSPLAIRLGLTDGSATEVLSGEVKEGTEVLIGLRNGQAPPSGPGSPRLRL